MEQNGERSDRKVKGNKRADEGKATRDRRLGSAASAETNRTLRSTASGLPSVEGKMPKRVSCHFILRRSSSSRELLVTKRIWTLMKQR